MYIQVLRHSHSVSYLKIAYTLDNWIGASLVNNLTYIFLVQETCLRCRRQVDTRSLRKKDGKLLVSKSYSSLQGERRIKKGFLISLRDCS